MSASVDCVIIGYNDPDFADLLARNEPYRDVSGGYRHLIVNSVILDGRRVKYFDLLNAARAAAGIQGPPLHVAKMPNLGVYYLASYLLRMGFNVEWVNFFNGELDQFEAMLQTRPKSVAITTTFYFEPHPIREIVDFVRKHSPTTRTIVGGPHIFNVCGDNPVPVQDVMFDEMGADIFVHDSQGESTLSRICLELRRPHPQLELIPNLVFRDERGSFRRTARQPESNDMNANAVGWSRFPATGLVPTVQTRTARSCAYKCAFCRYPIMAGNLDLMSLETIEKELDALRSIAVRYLLFIDDTFNIPMARFKDICRLMIRKQYGFKWFSYFRCANADNECFDLMAEAGCTGVFLGIESGDNGILKSMNKVATVEKYMSGIEKLNERDIMTYASFIVGYPPETEETAANTLAFIDAARPTFYCLETFFYDPKTPVASRSAEFELTGRGYSWHHRTMDWRRASDIVEHGYRTITGSIMVPLYGFDLWSVAYLLGAGMSRENITDFLELASTLLIDGVTSEPHRPPVDRAQLTAAVGAPYQLQ